MTVQRRGFTSLPEYLQTNRNNLELAVTDDLVYEPEQADFVSGYIGDTSKLSSQDLQRTPRLIENSPIRQKYQFSVGVAQFDPTARNFVSGAFYDDLLNHLFLNGALTDNPNRLFSSTYYAWSPPVDYDKIVNPARYVWTGTGTAALNGEYITKEAAGSQTVIFQFDGTSLVSHPVTIVNGLPGSGSSGQIVEDVSTTDRFIYKWTGAAWARINFQVADTTAVKTTYFTNDYIYVCRTGPSFNRPIVWVYRPTIGRWVSTPVVIDISPPGTPVVGMIWEDTSALPSRTLRIYDGNQWQVLKTGGIDVFDGSTITYGAGTPSGTPTVVTYRYDTRAISTVDSWSALNWWRAFTDLSASDRAALGSTVQATRPIVEFWGNIESASGDTRTTRNQFPLFNLYAVSTATFQIVPITPANFTGLNTAPLITSGNYVGGEVVSHIFNYVKTTGTNDAVLGFPVQYASDGTPQFYLELERLPITLAGVALLGYRFYRDTATGLVHSVWEKANTLLTQTADQDGLYNIPQNLKSNPDHVLTKEVDRSQFVNHFTAVMKSQSKFSGTPFGTNNYRFTPKDLTLGASMIDPQETLFRALAVLQTNTLDIPDAIRTMAREYNKVMAKFLNQLNTLWQNGTIANASDTLIVTTSQAVDIILTIIFSSRNSEFPFYYSNMGTFTDTRITGSTVYVFDPTPQPIYIPNSAAQIGAAPAFIPEKFTDRDGVKKLRGHDGSLLPAYGDARDDVIIALETRFFNAVATYLRDETSTFSSRFNNARFHLEDFYGNFKPTLTAGKVSLVVANYTSIVGPTANERVYSTNTNVFAIWNGTQWHTQDAQTNDVFQNLATGDYWIFNGFFAEIIPTDNNTSTTFDYSTNEFRQVIQREFERWVVQHKLDFITNNAFSNSDLFSWNFSSSGLEGNYRGIYRRVYRTVRPHSHPWEILGYSVRPSWWLTSYVPTSTAADGTPRYARTHAMWTDLQNGVINPISSTIKLSQKMVAPIPVDTSGNLIDPVASGLLVESSLTPASTNDDWQYGDGSPIEESFYASYYYPFAVALAGYLMKPGIFVDRTWSEFYRTIGETGSNLLWNAPHTVYNTTLTRPQASQVASQLSLDSSGNVVVNPGFNSWIAEYSNLIGKSPHADFDNAIKNCQGALGWKTSGFINQRRTRVELLNGDEIPQEDISVVLHQGPSTNEYFQSGIHIIRDTDGFRIFGTDLLNSFFRVELGAKPISGGQIETIQVFNYDGKKLSSVAAPTIKYARSAITTTNLTVPSSTNDTATFSVLINGYRIQDKFVQRIDSTTFGIDQFVQLNAGDKITVSVVTTSSNPSTQLASFTINHVTVTYFQTGTGVYVDYQYGHLFETLSDVVNMLIGHGRWLSSQGWIFERLTNGVLRDWLGAAQNFVQWATDLSTKNRGNAALMKGAIFEYSVMGRHTQFDAPFGMVLGIEEIRNGSYGVVDQTGQPIRGQHLDVVSTGGSLTVTSDTTDIFGLRLYVSEVQHVAFFPNTTTFNDIIYEPALGLAQDAVFIDTYRTTNWAGRMEAPGFLIHGGRLLPNWEKSTNDITRLYDRFNPPDDPVLLAMARNIFGYVPKAYMNELAIDDRSQFNFFRGTRKASGTFQPYLAFVRGTTLGSDKVTISEDWAWKFARMGDRRNVTVLFSVFEKDFVDIFQAIHFKGTALADDRIIEIPMFSPPTTDTRWVVPPPQDIYASKPYTFPVLRNGTVDYSKYLYATQLVDQTGVSPATDLFHWDPARDIHEPFARSFIEYKTAYDPARYNQGPHAEAAKGLVWGEAQVGQVWWNTATAIYENYLSFLPDTMRVTREWGRLKYFPATITRVDETVTVTTLDPTTKLPVAHGFTSGQTIVISGADQPTYNGTISVTVASATTFTFTVNVAANTPGTGDIIVQVGLINCYEWVASPVPPSTWASYVTSQQNNVNAYSGTVLNSANPSYVSREVWDVNGNSSTTYYFWVEHDTRTIPGKDISVNDIAGRLRNPAQYEVPYFGIIDAGTMFVFIGADVVLDGDAIEVSYQWYETPRHVEWMLIGENDDFADIPDLVTDKLLDSLIGKDVHGNVVPNATLAPVERYGTGFFPAQTVFQNPTDALTILVDSINNLLVGVDLKTTSDLFNFLVSTSDEKTNLNPTGFWSKTTYWVPNTDHTIIYDTVQTIAERDIRTGLGLYAKNDIVKVIQSDQLDLWVVTTYSLTSGTIQTAGTGYVNGDQISLVGGSHTSIAKLNVNTVTGMGGVLTYTTSQVGSYTILPPNPIFTLSNGSGTGFTFNATWVQSPFIAAYYQYDGTVWNLVGNEKHTVEINSNIILNPKQMRNFYKHLTDAFSTIDINKTVFNLLFEMVRQNPTIDWFFKTSYIDLHVSEPLPTSAFVRPDEANIVLSALKDLKPFRTKLRDQIVSLLAEREDVNVLLTEDPIQRDTLIFDRLACDLTDENAWDTIPWDATATSPDSGAITLSFVGDGVRSCFYLPEVVPPDHVIVLLNGVLAVPNTDYVFNSLLRSVCFTTIPANLTPITVLIDSQYEYFSDFSYAFRGDGVKNAVLLPILVADASATNVFTNWNGVRQRPINDYTVQVTSTPEVLYVATPSSEIEVTGLVFGGVINDIFTPFSFTSDGVTVQYHTNLGGLTTQNVLVSINGVWQSPNNAYSINSSNPSDNLVVLANPAVSGAIILISAATNPNFTPTYLYQFVGDGATAQYSVPALLDPLIQVMVNLNGIQQARNIDFTISGGQITFIEAPASNVLIDILGIGIGIGTRPAQVSTPQTVQWDWAFWDYADLGRKEYDFANILVGDGVTSSFTVSIPQTAPFLYDVVVKLFLNGVETTAAAMGLTMTVTKLTSSVAVFFNAPLPVTAYGAVYVARGRYEGLEPTFGYQDPNGVVFTPTPSSYQHFFARLISATFDPSTVMQGCPTPEERIETGLDDMFTVVVKTYPEQIFLPALANLIGQQAITQLAIFAGSNLHIDSQVLLTGVSATAQQNFISLITNVLRGLSVTSSVGTFIPSILFTTSVFATANVGTFNGTTLVPLSGNAATAQFGTLGVQNSPNTNLVGVAATAQAGILGILISQSFGQAATTQFGTFAFNITSSPTMTGVVATAQAGVLLAHTSLGESVFALVGTFVPTVGVIPTVPAAVSAVGSLAVEPWRVQMIGVGATSGVGTMSASIS